MAAINPYISFNGNCEEAFDFYASVFGGETSTKMRYSDMPAEYAAPEGEAKKILHVALPIGGGTTLMGSDRMGAHGADVNGDNFSVSVIADSRAEADTVFGGLSDGGKVTMPLAEAFWGAYFGMVTDKYGVNWMINHDNPQQ